MARSKKTRSSRAPRPATEGAPGPRVHPAAYWLGAVLAIQPLVLDLFATDEYETPKTIFLRCAVALMAGVWFWCAARRGVGDRFSLRSLPLLAYAAVMTVATLTSTWPLTSLLGEYGSLAGLQNQIWYLAICASALLLPGVREVRTVAILVLCGGMLSTGMALVEAAGYEIGVFFGLSAEIPAHTTSGTFGNPNYFSGYTVALLPVSAALIADRRRWVQLLATLLTVASAVAVVLSGSRTGIACIALFALWAPAHAILRWRWRDGTEAAIDPGQRRRFRQRLAVVAAAIIAVATLSALIAPNQLSHIGRSLTRPLVKLSDDRTHLWWPALHVARDHPLLGGGLDTYGVEAPKYFEPRVYERLGASVIARRAHNEVLNMLANGGLIGVAAWLWLFGGAIWAGIRRARDRTLDVDQRALAMALATGLFFGLGFNTLHFVTTGQAPWLFALAGLLLGPLQEPRGGGPTRLLSRRGSWIGVAISAALGLFLLYDGAVWLKADIHLKHSIVFGMRGRQDAAREELKRAVALRPLERRYREASAQMHLRAAQATTSEGARKTYLQRARDDVAGALRTARAPLALWIALSIEQKAEQIDAAAEYAREALARDPTRPKVLASTVDWFLRRGRLDLVGRLIDLVYPRHPEHAADVALAVVGQIARQP
ncbi:MAG: O-antigen ligase family protein, partial [Deltaproteobacteria bacterium]|nr:O-antigen ligase family protein [Deltaproteobacteria bacterium]